MSVIIIFVVSSPILRGFPFFVSQLSELFKFVYIVLPSSSCPVARDPFEFLSHMSFFPSFRRFEPQFIFFMSGSLITAICLFSFLLNFFMFLLVFCSIPWSSSATTSVTALMAPAWFAASLLSTLLFTMCWESWFVSWLSGFLFLVSSERLCLLMGGDILIESLLLKETPLTSNSFLVPVKFASPSVWFLTEDVQFSVYDRAGPTLPPPTSTGTGVSLPCTVIVHSPPCEFLRHF